MPFARLPKAQQAMARLLSPMLNKPGPVHQTEEPRLLRALERGSLEPLRPTVPPPKRKKRKSRKKRAASTSARRRRARNVRFLQHCAGCARWIATHSALSNASRQQNCSVNSSSGCSSFLRRQIQACASQQLTISKGCWSTCFASAMRSTRDLTILTRGAVSGPSRSPPAADMPRADASRPSPCVGFWSRQRLACVRRLSPALASSSKQGCDDVA